MEEKGLRTPLQLEFDSHDEIFGMVKRIKQKNLFPDSNQAKTRAKGKCVRK